MDNPEKLTTCFCFVFHPTHDKEKQNKNTTQYMLDTTICKRTQINEICDLFLVLISMSLL